MADQFGRILGYADEIGVAPGQTISFMVSCEPASRYRADIVRVVNGDPNPDGPGFKEVVVRTPVNGEYEGRRQDVHAGSYAVVPPRARLDDLASFSVLAAIWPTTPHKGEQIVLAHWSARSKAGFQLLIDGAGATALRLGDGSGRVEVVSAGKPLLEREWYLIGAAYDASAKTMTVYQEPFERFATLETGAEASRSVRLRYASAGATPLTMAATITRTVKGRHVTADHFNGKIDSPRLADRALSRSAMTRLLQDRLPSDVRSAVVAAWDFSGDILNTQVRDKTANGLHGEVINLPTRAMTGYNWTGDIFDWTVAPEQYGAIHFHDDDLYDCGWEPDFALTVPKSMKSGSYAARLRTDQSEEYVPFYVRPPHGTATAKIAYLVPTASYLAYANGAMAPRAQAVELMLGRLIEVQPWEQFLIGHPEFGLSLYDEHSDGSGVCYSSRLRPMVNMRPRAKLCVSGGSGLWAYNADTHLTAWLEHEGFVFDVITDEDLHEEGVELLSRYNVVLTGTHPEYTSEAMWDAMKAYTQQGGRFMYMGGNGFYWHTAYHVTLPGVIEVRRGEDGTRAWRSLPGEFYHSFDGDYACLWRHHGKAPQALAGAGFISQGFDISSYYRRTAASNDSRIAWAFDGIGQDELIGDFGLQGGGAAGIEVDIADRALGTPPNALVVAMSEELTDSYLLVNEEQVVATADQIGTANPRIRADLVFHETPNGGAVFAFSSIAWCGSLPWNNFDNNVARLTGNVLRRFAADEPFPSPGG